MRGPVETLVQHFPPISPLFLIPSPVWCHMGSIWLMLPTESIPTLLSNSQIYAVYTFQRSPRGFGWGVRRLQRAMLDFLGYWVQIPSAINKMEWGKNKIIAFVLPPSIPKLLSDRGTWGKESTCKCPEFSLLVKERERRTHASSYWLASRFSWQNTWHNVSWRPSQPKPDSIVSE